MSLLLLGCLSDALLVLVDAVDHLGVVVRNVQHFRSLVARHAKILDQQDQL